MSLLGKLLSIIGKMDQIADKFDLAFLIYLFL